MLKVMNNKLCDPSFMGTKTRWEWKSFPTTELCICLRYITADVLSHCIPTLSLVSTYYNESNFTCLVPMLCWTTKLNQKLKKKAWWLFTSWKYGLELNFWESIITTYHSEYWCVLLSLPPYNFAHLLLLPLIMEN